MQTAEEGAKRIFDAIVTNNPEKVIDIFFPLEPFIALKDLKNAQDYHKKLVDWYVKDIQREHNRIKMIKDPEFIGFKSGFCKWKDIGSETNKLAYWSCYRNKIFGKSQTGDKFEIELRAMINWGERWYVTHLGKPGS